MCWGRDALRASGERSRGVLRERGAPENRRIGRKTWENKAIRGKLALEYLLFWGFTVAFHNLNVCPNSRARGDQFKGEEAGGGRFLALWVDKAEAACWRFTQAIAACRTVPFLGGGREGAAAAWAARYKTERR